MLHLGSRRDLIHNAAARTEVTFAAWVAAVRRHAINVSLIIERDPSKWTPTVRTAGEALDSRSNHRA
jgi:hypothetical protein